MRGKKLLKTCNGEHNHHEDVLQGDPGWKLEEDVCINVSQILKIISFLLVFGSFPFEGNCCLTAAVSRALRYSLLSAGLLGQPPHDRNTNTRTTTDTNTRRTTNTNTSKAQPSSERNANTNTNSF